MFVVFSDIHIHPHRRYAHDLGKGITSRMQDALNVMDQVKEEMESRKIKSLIFAGDMFDAKSRIPVVAINEAYKKADELFWDDHCLWMTGNHDYITRDGAKHALEVWKDVNVGWTVLDAPRIWLDDQHEILFHCVPFKERFTEEDFDVQKAIEESYLSKGFLNSSKPKIVLLTHACVEGLTELPIPLPEDPRQPYKEWVRAAWLESYDFVISGHVHDPFVNTFSFPSGKKCKGLSVGQPYQESWDSQGDRGFWIFDPEEDEPFEFVESKAPKVIHWNHIDSEETLHKFEQTLSAEQLQGHIVVLEPARDALELYGLLNAFTQRLLADFKVSFVEIMPFRGKIERTEATDVRLSSALQKPIDMLRHALEEGMIKLSKGASVSEIVLKAEKFLS